MTATDTQVVVRGRFAWVFSGSSCENETKDGPKSKPLLKRTCTLGKLLPSTNF